MSDIPFSLFLGYLKSLRPIFHCNPPWGRDCSLLPHTERALLFPSQPSSPLASPHHHSPSHTSGSSSHLASPRHPSLPGWHLFSQFSYFYFCACFNQILLHLYNGSNFNLLHLCNLFVLDRICITIILNLIFWVILCLYFTLSYQISYWAYLEAIHFHIPSLILVGKIKIVTIKYFSF